MLERRKFQQEAPLRSKSLLPIPEASFPPDQPPPSNFGDALRAIQNKALIGSQAYQRQQWRANREGAHPTILEFERVLIKRLAKLNIPMFAHCVVRTKEEQLNLFLDGHSKDSPDDGLWPHQGCAVDIIHSVRAWNLSRVEWALIGHVGKELANAPLFKGNIEWGGDWKFYDPAHWQLRDWKQQEGFPWPTIK